MIWIEVVEQVQRDFQRCDPKRKERSYMEGTIIYIVMLDRWVRTLVRGLL